jgi:hypothetical protein
MGVVVIDVRVVAAWTSWVAIVIGVMLLVAACDDLSVEGGQAAAASRPVDQDPPPGSGPAPQPDSRRQRDDAMMFGRTYIAHQWWWWPSTWSISHHSWRTDTWQGDAYTDHILCVGPLQLYWRGP